MDRNQAAAVIRAMLEPDLKAREELRNTRQKQAIALVMQRRAAGAALIGMGLGAAIGYFAFADTSPLDSSLVALAPTCSPASCSGGLPDIPFNPRTRASRPVYPTSTQMERYP